MQLVLSGISCLIILTVFDISFCEEWEKVVLDYSNSSGAYIRQDFSRIVSALLKRVEDHLDKNGGGDVAAFYEIKPPKSASRNLPANLARLIRKTISDVTPNLNYRISYGQSSELSSDGHEIKLLEYILSLSKKPNISAKSRSRQLDNISDRSSGEDSDRVSGEDSEELGRFNKLLTEKRKERNGNDNMVQEIIDNETPENPVEEIDMELKPQIQNGKNGKNVKYNGNKGGPVLKYPAAGSNLKEKYWNDLEAPDDDFKKRINFRIGDESSQELNSQTGRIPNELRIFKKTPNGYQVSKTMIKPIHYKRRKPSRKKDLNSIGQSIEEIENVGAESPESNLVNDKITRIVIGNPTSKNKWLITSKPKYLNSNQPGNKNFKVKIGGKPVEIEESPEEIRGKFWVGMKEKPEEIEEVKTEIKERNSPEYQNSDEILDNLSEDPRETQFSTKGWKRKYERISGKSGNPERMLESTENVEGKPKNIEIKKIVVINGKPEELEGNPEEMEGYFGDIEGKSALVKKNPEEMEEIPVEMEIYPSKIQGNPSDIEEIPEETEEKLAKSGKPEIIEEISKEVEQKPGDIKTDSLEIEENLQQSEEKPTEEEILAENEEKEKTKTIDEGSTEMGRNSFGMNGKTGKIEEKPVEMEGILEETEEIPLDINEISGKMGRTPGKEDMEGKPKEMKGKPEEKEKVDKMGGGSIEMEGKSSERNEEPEKMEGEPLEIEGNYGGIEEEPEEVEGEMEGKPEMVEGKRKKVEDSPEEMEGNYEGMEEKPEGVKGEMVEEKRKDIEDSPGEKEGRAGNMGEKPRDKESKSTETNVADMGGKPEEKEKPNRIGEESVEMGKNFLEKPEEIIGKPLEMKGGIDEEPLDLKGSSVEMEGKPKKVNGKWNEMEGSPGDKGGKFGDTKMKTDEFFREPEEMERNLEEMEGNLESLGGKPSDGNHQQMEENPGEIEGKGVEIEGEPEQMDVNKKEKAVEMGKPKDKPENLSVTSEKTPALKDSPSDDQISKGKKTSKHKKIKVRSRDLDLSSDDQDSDSSGQSGEEEEENDVESPEQNSLTKKIAKVIRGKPSRKKGRLLRKKPKFLKKPFSYITDKKTKGIEKEPEEDADMLARSASRNPKRKGLPEEINQEETSSESLPTENDTKKKPGRNWKRIMKFRAGDDDEVAKKNPEEEDKLKNKQVDNESKSKPKYFEKGIGRMKEKLRPKKLYPALKRIMSRGSSSDESTDQDSKEIVNNFSEDPKGSKLSRKFWKKKLEKSTEKLTPSTNKSLLDWQKQQRKPKEISGEEASSRSKYPINEKEKSEEVSDNSASPRAKYQINGQNPIDSPEEKNSENYFATRPIRIVNWRSSLKKPLMAELLRGMEMEEFEEDAPSSILFTFKIPKRTMSNTKIDEIIEDINLELQDLEPASKIYPAHLICPKDSDISIQIPVDFPPAKSMTLIKLLERFPDIKGNYLKITNLDLDELPSKINEILEYELFMARIVDSGKKIPLQLRFKIKNEKRNGEFLPGVFGKMTQHLSTIPGVKLKSYGSKNIGNRWILLTIKIFMNYSSEQAHKGLGAIPEGKAAKKKYNGPFDWKWTIF